MSRKKKLNTDLNTAPDGELFAPLPEGVELQTGIKPSGNVVEKAIRLDQLRPNTENPQPRRVTPRLIEKRYPDADRDTQLDAWREEVERRVGQSLDLPALLTNAEDATLPDVPQIEVNGKTQPDPIVSDYYDLLGLAARIQDEGQTNAITYIKEGRRKLIDTGERRWTAFHLLRKHVDADKFGKIRATEKDDYDAFRVISENTGRRNLIAIGLTASGSLSIMEAHRRAETGIEFRPATDFDHIRDFYAQVREHGVPYGWKDTICSVMGGLARQQVDKYIKLLDLTPEQWDQAHDEAWPLDYGLYVLDQTQGTSYSKKKSREKIASPGRQSPDSSPTYKRGDRIRNERGELGTITHPQGNDGRVGIVYDNMITARRPVAELTPAPDEPPPPLGYRMKISSGRSDDGAEHRAIMVAQELINAGLWDNIGQLWFENVYDIHAAVMGSVSDITVNDLVLKKELDRLTVSLPAQPENTGSNVNRWHPGDACTVIGHGPGIISKVLNNNQYLVNMDNEDKPRTVHANILRERTRPTAPDNTVSKSQPGNGAADTDTDTNRPTRREVKAGMVIILTDGRRAKITQRLFNGDMIRLQFEDGSTADRTYDHLESLAPDQSWDVPPPTLDGEEYRPPFVNGVAVVHTTNQTGHIINAREGDDRMMVRLENGSEQYWKRAGFRVASDHRFRVGDSVRLMDEWVKITAFDADEYRVFTRICITKPNPTNDGATNVTTWMSAATFMNRLVQSEGEGNTDGDTDNQVTSSDFQPTEEQQASLVIIRDYAEWLRLDDLTQDINALGRGEQPQRPAAVVTEDINTLYNTLLAHFDNFMDVLHHVTGEA